MNMPEKYIFFLDADGTLYTNGFICERNRKAVKKMREQGHLVFLNTGRAPGIVPQEVNDIELDGRITALGSNIKVGDKTILSDFIPTDELKYCFEQMDTAGRKILFEGNDIVLINSLYDPCGYNAVRVKNAEEFAEKYGNRKIPKIFIPHVLPEDEGRYYAERYTFCQHPTYVEIAPKGNSKASSMQKVLDYLLPEKYISVACGDSLNDIEMLCTADIAVGMGDSHPDIIKYCDIVTCNGEDGGVAEAMYKITGIKED